MVEFSLPLGLALEVDALYHRLGYRIDNLNPDSGTESARANSWEFPVLLKYKFSL